MPMYSSIKAFLMSQIFAVYKNNNHDPSVSSENAINIRKKKKFPEVPQHINSLMFSTVYMLLWHLVFRGGGTGQEPSLLQAPGKVALTRHSLEWGGCPLVLDGVPEQCGVLEVSPGLGVPLEPPSSLGGPLGPF